MKKQIKKRRCTKCGISKTLTEFYNDKYGKSSRCKCCARILAKERFIELTNTLKQLIPQSKQCTTCAITKRSSAFYRLNGSPDGLEEKCSSCSNKDTKICSKCGLDKSLGEYYGQASCRDGRVGQCKVCIRTERTRYRKVPKNKARIKQRRVNRYSKYRTEIARIKDVPCMDCGCRFPPCAMDFDHRPDEKKLFNIAQASLSNKDRILLEIAKCDVVCANCHRIRTLNRIRKKKQNAGKNEICP